MSYAKSNLLQTTKNAFFENATKCLPDGSVKGKFIGDIVNGKKRSDEIIHRKYECICATFGIKKSESTFRLFDEAVSGSGSEWKEINQLNSSTLLSFLCFHQVSAQTPLWLTLGNRKVKFTQVHFEKKNNLPYSTKFKHSHPSSNIDVFLTDDKNEFELHLESKFTEYLNRQTNYSVRCYYGEQYDQLFYNRNFGDEYTFEHNGAPTYEHCAWKAKDGKRHYLEGIKQMVSHYLGLTERRKTHTASKTRIYLGEILFDFANHKTSSNLADDFLDYKNCHHLLYKKLKEHSTKHKCGVTAIGDLFTYQKIFSSPDNSLLLMPTVKAFYKLGAQKSQSN